MWYPENKLHKNFISLYSNVFFYLLLRKALDCPANSSYSLCVSSCPETCVGAGGPPGCEDVCVEGCKCNPGFILSNDKCVALKDCGCLDTGGSYHPVSKSGPWVATIGKIIWQTQNTDLIERCCERRTSKKFDCQHKCFFESENRFYSVCQSQFFVYACF